uniref:Uncharacterized protein n=1 Tax=Vespula pensylvanica TaxID=30213 RepID=A0A834PA38_VESPE|nr:hypothetical protein H0235_002437 [Vespula pensylvanica]
MKHIANRLLRLPVYVLWLSEEELTIGTKWMDEGLERNRFTLYKTVMALECFRGKCEKVLWHGTLANHCGLPSVVGLRSIEYQNKVRAVPEAKCISELPFKHNHRDSNDKSNKILSDLSTVGNAKSDKILPDLSTLYCGNHCDNSNKELFEKGERKTKEKIRS